MFKLLYVLFHYVPAFFIDIGLRLNGSNLRLMKIYNKIYYQFQLYLYFNEHSWKFSDINMQKVYSRMNAGDHEEFPCIARAEDYEQHYCSAINGIRKYFLKESEEDLVAARRQLKVMKVLQFAFLASIYASCAYFIYQHSPKFVKINF